MCSYSVSVDLIYFLGCCVESVIVPHVKIIIRVSELQESGLMLAPGNRLDETPRTLPLALFLLAQNDYWYLGISSGWMDKDWGWYPEYNKFYGKPRGRAVETTNPPGWKREFEGCTVTVTADLQNATIVFHNQTS